MQAGIKLKALQGPHSVLPKPPGQVERGQVGCLMPGMHLLEGQLLIVGLDAADVVWRRSIQGLHEQVQGGAELWKQTPVLD